MAIKGIFTDAAGGFSFGFQTSGPDFRIARASVLQAQGKIPVNFLVHKHGPGEGNSPGKVSLKFWQIQRRGDGGNRTAVTCGQSPRRIFHGGNISPPANSGFAQKGQKVKVGGDSGIKQHPRIGGGHTKTLGPLINHGNITNDDISIFPKDDVVFHSLPQGNIRDSAGASPGIRGFGRENPEHNVFFFLFDEEKSGAPVIPALGRFSRFSEITKTLTSGLAQCADQILPDAIRIHGNRLFHGRPDWGKTVGAFSPELTIPRRVSFVGKDQRELIGAVVRGDQGDRFGVGSQNLDSR